MAFNYGLVEKLAECLERLKLEYLDAKKSGKKGWYNHDPDIVQARQDAEDRFYEALKDVIDDRVTEILREKSET